MHCLRYEFPKKRLLASARLVSLIVLFTSFVGAPSGISQWDPAQGDWSKIESSHLRVMTWNVEDGIASQNTKVEGLNNWSALARIVASLKPDVLMLQEAGDNNGVDSVSDLETTIDLFLHGGTDPFLGGTVSSFVQAYAPSYDLPHVFVSVASDGFNRNVILSRFPFSDLNGDGRSQLSDLAFIIPDAYAPGGTGGIRGFQHAEIDLPDGIYSGDLVLGNGHLKAGGSSGDLSQRLTASQNIAYYFDYLYNGAGTGIPDPNGRIVDSPPATTILDENSFIILGGDLNEDEGSNGRRGPATWVTEAEFFGTNDGTDKDRSDMTFDDARDFFSNDGDTQGSSKLDYLCAQDSVVSEALSFLFESATIPGAALPPELVGYPLPNLASQFASDHLPVIVDYNVGGPPPPDEPVVINEIYYDAPGADGGQVFVEIFGTPGTNIGGWMIQGIEGSGGSAGNPNAESFTFPGGTVIPGDGILVVADEDGGGTSVPNADFLDADMDLENGPDAVHLLDDQGQLVDAVAYGAVTASVGEGSPCRDVFAPLGIERCVAGNDTDDNAADLLPNVPTPGVATELCRAIEWVDLGSGNSVSWSGQEAVGLDFWLSTAANQTYYVVFSCQDPSIIPPPPPFPVYDALCTPVGLRSLNLPPFISWTGSLGGLGESVGTARFDFSGIPDIGFNATLEVWIGVLAFDAQGDFVSTNSVQVTIEP